MATSTSNPLDLNIEVVNSLEDVVELRVFIVPAIKRAWTLVYLIRLSLGNAALAACCSLCQYLANQCDIADGQARAMIEAEQSIIAK